MRRYVWIGITVVGVILIGLALRPQAMPMDLGYPERQVIQEYIAEEAHSRLAREYVVDMPVGGTLKRIPLEVGDVVAQGDVLAQVDTHDLAQQLRGLDSLIAQAQAKMTGVDVEKPKEEDLKAAVVNVQALEDALEMAQRDARIAEIDLKEARRNYERMQDLIKEGVTSQSEYDSAERAYRAAEQLVSRMKLAEQAATKALEQAGLAERRLAGSVDDNEYMRAVYQAEVERLRAERDIVQSDLDKCVIHAPVSGPVLEKYIDSTRVLMPGTPLLKLGDVASQEIESDILSEEVGRIEVGDPVEIFGKALQGETITGEVTRIYPSAFKKISSLGIEQQRVKVLIAYDTETINLRAGTRVDVRIITDRHDDALTVPERATFRRNGAWHVFTVEDGTATLTPVTVGLRNETLAEILDGVTEEKQIVTEPTNSLEAGMKLVGKE